MLLVCSKEDEGMIKCAARLQQKSTYNERISIGGGVYVRVLIVHGDLLDDLGLQYEPRDERTWRLVKGP